MTTISETSSAIVGTPAEHLGRAVSRATHGIKRAMAGPLHLEYPGQSDTGDHFAEVFLTWYFGRGSVMWRARFVSEQAAQSAAQAHARFLDGVLPTHYRAENWSGRPYMEKHEYGIAWGAGKSADRPPEELAPVWRTTLPGE